MKGSPVGAGPMEHSMRGRVLWDVRLGGQQHVTGCRVWARLTLLALGWWELVCRVKGPPQWLSRKDESLGDWGGAGAAVQQKGVWDPGVE